MLTTNIKSNKSQFDYVLKQIQNDSYEENKSNFDKLKSYMLSYDKKDRWSKRIETNLLIT